MATFGLGLGLPYTHGRTDKYLCSAAAWVLGRRTENSEESHPTLFFRTAADESGSPRIRSSNTYRMTNPFPYGMFPADRYIRLLMFRRGTSVLLTRSTACFLCFKE